MLRRPCYCPKHHLFPIWREYSVFEVRPLNTVTFSGMKRLGRIFCGVEVVVDFQIPLGLHRG